MCMYLYKLAAKRKAFSCSCVKCIHIHVCTHMCINTYIYTLFFFSAYHASQFLTRPAGKFRTCSPKPFFDTGWKRVCKAWGRYWDPRTAAPGQGCLLDTSHETCGGAELCISFVSFAGVFFVLCCFFVFFFFPQK